ncbi:MAG: replication-relaxation family protein [Planctomycetia bacterium]|nr:replication-relaxation family protein [Planctomycetia bacterium]
MPLRRNRRVRKPNILRHYPALVEYVFNSRYATASQVERRFPEWLTSDRTARWQMTSLVELRLLGIASVRSTSPNFPFVYFATPRGVRLIRDTYARLGVTWKASATEESRLRGQAMDTVLHELLVTEFELAVWQTVRSKEDLELVFTERRYFRRDRQLRFGHEGRVHRIAPDAGFLVTWPREGTADGTTQNKAFATDRDGLLHFVELDNGTMSPQRIREKFQAYARWARSESAERYLRDVYDRAGLPGRRPNFRLLIIAHDKLHPGRDDARLQVLLAQALTLPLDVRRKVWLTAAQRLREQQHSPAPLAASIWLHARDAGPARDDLHHERAVLAAIPLKSLYS